MEISEQMPWCKRSCKFTEHITLPFFDFATCNTVQIEMRDTLTHKFWDIWCTQKFPLIVTFVFQKSHISIHLLKACIDITVVWYIQNSNIFNCEQKYLNFPFCQALDNTSYVKTHSIPTIKKKKKKRSSFLEYISSRVQPINDLETLPPFYGRCIASTSRCIVALSWEYFHRFGPVCFPATLLAVLPKVHWVDCFFLGTGVFALPLKAFVGSNLLRWESPAGSTRLASLVKVSGWYSDAHCCRDKILLALMAQ